MTLSKSNSPYTTERSQNYLTINQRVRQRGITNRMIELTLDYGIVLADKIKLGTRRIRISTYHGIQSELK